MAQKSFSSDVLNQLLSDTDSAVAQLEKRAETTPDLDTRFADIQSKFDEASNIKDDNEREMRMKILEADFQEIRKDAATEEQDLAQAVFGLNAMLESMGAEYSELTNLNDDEQGIIDNAQAALERAKLQRAKAGDKWFFKQSAIESAEQEIEKAKTALQEAQIEAKRQSRQRLLTADMEASLQEFLLRVEKTIHIMENRMGAIDSQLKAVSARKAKAFQVKEEAARALEELDQRLNGKEEDLRREEDLLASYENGTDEHAAQSKKISDLRADVEGLRGSRNTAFVLHQSKDKFATELEVHERTQMKLRDNQRMWITSLRSDTEERVVTFRSRLEAMKAASDQDIAKTLDDLGAEADQRNAEYMAKVGAASDRIRMEKIEKHPERIANIARVAAAQAEAIQQIRIREREAINKFKELYGIDPTASSFFHYQDDEQEDSSGGSNPSSGIF
jgi:hypothetical protein